MSRGRISQLKPEQIDEIAKKVLKEIGGPSGDDSSGDEESPDGVVMLFDEGQPQREARIAFRMTAMDFPTRDALKKYQKEHPDADPANLHVVPTKEIQKAPDEKTKERQKGKPDITKERQKGKPEEQVKPKGKPEEQKPQVQPKQQEKPGVPGKQPPQNDVQKKQVPEEKKQPPKKQQQDTGEEIDINEKLVEQVGRNEAKNWKTSPVHKSQLTSDVLVKFPDGTSKKYKDLDDNEKQRVTDALEKGQAAHKGLNDYSKVDVTTFKSNMANNLSKYDNKDIEETKNESQDKANKENVDEFTKSAAKNAKSVIEKYSGAMSNVSRPMVENHTKNMITAISEGVKDGSLADVSQADLDDMIREDIKRLVHQEIETRGRSLGDHGIRHCTANSENSVNMLSQLKESGANITGKDKLMALTIQANHDMGYTMGQAAVDVMAKGAVGHQHNSGILSKDKEEQARYAKVFGKDAPRMAEIIETHDSTDIDWEADPVASAVRLSDSIALFGKDKVQDLFLRSDKAIALACKLQLAASMAPKNPGGEPKREKFKTDEDFSKATEKYKINKAEFDKPESQAQLKESRRLQSTVKEQLHGTIDEEEFDDNDKELLHKQVDEMTEEGFSTSMDILSRYSGRVKEIKFDKSSKVMNVDMGYSPEGQVLDGLFGDKMTHRQFGKFTDDMGSDKGSLEAVGGDQGKTMFRSRKTGKPIFQLNIDGFSDKPESTAKTEAMKSFVKETARTDLNQARKLMMPPPAEIQKNIGKAFDTLKKSRGKFSDEEWGKVESLFKDNADKPDVISKQLANWPVLKSERKFVETKVARVSRMLFASVIKDLQKRRFV